ncbi:MAG: photosystem II reaction center PsbP [Synechococcales bacterium]|nr:photosystem II reaction center PsbP [Synechococcales bacterium]
MQDWEDSSTMVKRIVAIAVILMGLCLQSCVSGTIGLRSYIDPTDGYEFVYPNGWVEITVPNGPDVVIHDIVDPSENISVIISEVPDGKTLADLGTPTDVGQRLAHRGLSAAGDRNAELVNAEAKESDIGPYYLLEYAVQLPGQVRHNLASVVVRRGKLFTFNASTTEQRWSKMKEILRQAVQSFSVY